MLNVVSLEQAKECLINNFLTYKLSSIMVPLIESYGMCLAKDIVSSEFVPDFCRATVDGYAVIAESTFGCSEAMPAILKVVNEEIDDLLPLQTGECRYVPTGSQIPGGADAMVMIEHVEVFFDGTIGVLKPTAPGNHLIFRGEDVKPGQCILKKGTLLKTKEIGILAAMGIDKVCVSSRPVVGIISTGDEIVSYETSPQTGQVRDVNAPMFLSYLKRNKYQTVFFGIVKDDYNEITEAIKRTILKCDILILTGGTSAGEKDMLRRVLEKIGMVHIHGIALKPGKPTIIGSVLDKPVFGVPGNPLAAYFIFHLLIVDCLYKLQGGEIFPQKIRAIIDTDISSNHGRKEIIPVILSENSEVVDNIEQMATPIIGKSGLISTLLMADGYIIIERNSEGLNRGQLVDVYFLQ